MQLHAGMNIGRWTLTDYLGGGGNGRVWLATSEQGEEAALKFLIKVKPVALKRFKYEVKTQRDNSDIEGILPVLDMSLPDAPDQGPAWFAMPLAQPAKKALKAASPIKIAKAVVQLAKTVAKLHARNIGHRDIKPSNILFRKGRIYLTDFGLVTHPKKEDLTGTKEDIGPRWTIAPEMRRDAKQANPQSADVYSLAKTLWILLTGQEKGFEGQYNPNSEIGLRPLLTTIHLSGLESLLESATSHNPKGRPSMNEFAAQLESWHTDASEYIRHNPLDWSEAQRALFPVAIPTRASWENLDTISSILNHLGNISSLGHLFFPGGAGMDLTGASRSWEEGCLELSTQGLFSIVKPSRLMFESFGHDPQWNYFRLEIEGLPLSKFNKGAVPRHYEELLELDGRKYVPTSYLDEREDSDEDSASTTKAVARYITSGALVLFQKTSIYNKISGTYDGRHNTMSADAFREYIANGIKRRQERGIK